MDIQITGFTPYAGETSQSDFLITIDGVEYRLESWVTRNSSGEELYRVDTGDPAPLSGLVERAGVNYMEFLDALDDEKNGFVEVLDRHWDAHHVNAAIQGAGNAALEEWRLAKEER